MAMESRSTEKFNWPTVLRVAQTLLMYSVAGCAAGSSDVGPFGPAEESPLLVPFAGHWVCDAEKTFAAMRASGVTEEQIAQLRKLTDEHPEFGGVHPDMTISGNVAVTDPVSIGPLRLVSEYRFFRMHRHGDKACGQAWHHEDRFDPGDMSKCYVRLQLIDDALHFDLRMRDGLIDLDDPDLRSSPPVEGGSPANCQADDPPGEDWGAWTTCVFTRQP